MTMTTFQSSNPNLSDMIDTYGDLPWYEELARRTGISFEWQMSSLATVEEQFNLLIAANDLPNLICTANYYTDGTASAVENEIFTNLAPYLDEYAPDYKRLSQQDHVKLVFYDENGNIAAFYEIGREEFAPNNGVVIRGDLLEEQGLDVPITYDDYKQTLTAIKEAYGTPDPIFLYPDNTKWISAGKNVQMGFSLDENGETIYGPIEDNFREYLKIIHDWYESGLIYKDFHMIPEGQNINYLIQKMSSGKSVVTFGYCEFAGMIQLDEGQNLVAGYVPRDDKDEMVHLTDGVDRIANTGRAFALGPTMMLHGMNMFLP